MAIIVLTVVIDGPKLDPNLKTISSPEIELEPIRSDSLCCHFVSDLDVSFPAGFVLIQYVSLSVLILNGKLTSPVECMCYFHYSRQGVKDKGISGPLEKGWNKAQTSGQESQLVAPWIVFYR